MKATQQVKGAILVIESDSATRSGMKFLLEKYGYQVSAAIDEREFAAITPQQRYDLILFDAGLAPPESFLAAYRVSQQPELEGIPMIAISISPKSSLPFDHPDIDNFAVAYLSKISRFDQLEKLINCLLSDPALSKER